jgi:PTH1 family peptidyl-tRNA hydrolase
MRLLVGLGNPGPRYQNTRHNLGWAALEEIIRQYGLTQDGRRFHGRFGSGQVGSERVAWLMPETYMNLSGQSVGEAVRFYKVPPESVLVFHDDLDLVLGRVKVKPGGGNGGHNGLKSIQQILGTPDFIRVRLGIGRPPGRMDPARYVLAPLTSDEQAVTGPRLTFLARELPALLDGQFSQAMNRLALHFQTLEEVAS